MLGLGNVVFLLSVHLQYTFINLNLLLSTNNNIGIYMTQRKIKELRFKLEMTQVQFADKVGVKISTVKSWEGGINRPNERYEYKLKQIAKEL